MSHLEADCLSALLSQSPIMRSRVLRYLPPNKIPKTPNLCQITTRYDIEYLFPSRFINYNPSRRLTIEQFPKLGKLDASFGSHHKEIRQRRSLTMSSVDLNPSTGFNSEIKKTDPISNESDPEPLQTQDEVEDEEIDDDEDIDDDEEYIEHSNLARDLFTSITSRFSPMSHKDDSLKSTNFTDFKALGREALDALLVEVLEKNEGDLFITKPPLKTLTIDTLNNDDPEAHQCPCCIDNVEAGKATVKIEAENGITRRIFLEALRDQIYGKDIPAENLRLTERHRGMPLLRSWNYMMQDKDADGNETFYWGGEGQKLWLFCSDRLMNDEKNVLGATKL